MYLEIYPDIIFILNFFMDFILLYLLKKVSRKNSSLKRMLGAAAVGGIFTVMVSIFPWINIILRFLIMNVAASIIMVWIAFGKMKKLELFKQIVALYLITYFVGGLINSIYYYTNTREKLIKIGTSLILSNKSWKIVIITMLCMVPISYLVLWMLRWYQSEKKETYEVELTYNNHSIVTRGLMDTGNCLYDPIFKKPVMIVENSLLKELLPTQAISELENARSYLENTAVGVAPKINDEYLLRFRMIPYQSIGRSKGMMLGVILDKVLIHTGKETICNEKVTVAIYDNHLSVKDDYHVILHKELM